MFDEDAKQWLRNLLGPGVRFEESMARHTAFRIGGPAEALVQPENEAQLKDLVQWAQQQKIPFLILGGGSNLLVRDGGIRGLVIGIQRLAAQVQWEQKGSRVMVTAGGGVPTKRLCVRALRHGWQGMNFALGIPGTLGGAILMNAGTATGCMADILSGVTVMTGQGQKVRVTRNQIDARYRQLRLPAHLETGAAGPAILMEAELLLTAADRDRIRREARRVMQARTRRQPIWQPSAGSFFKNPAADIPAGRLIDEAGLKGLKVGRAEVSHRHANFIVNRGGATAADVLVLADQVRRNVQARFNILLHPEVCIVGQEKKNA